MHKIYTFYRNKNKNLSSFRRKKSLLKIVSFNFNIRESILNQFEMAL